MYHLAQSFSSVTSTGRKTTKGEMATQPMFTWKSSVKPEMVLTFSQTAQKWKSEAAQVAKNKPRLMNLSHSQRWKCYAIPHRFHQSWKWSFQCCLRRGWTAASLRHWTALTYLWLVANLPPPRESQQNWDQFVTLGERQLCWWTFTTHKDTVPRLTLLFQVT